MLHKLLYYLLYGILYLLSLLPFRALYWFSDLIRFVLFRIIGYRKAIVYDNVKKSFPDKDELWIKEVIAKFETSFCDQWVELIKSISISKHQLMARVQGNWEIFNDYHEQNKNCFVLMGHLFNWEWASNSCQVNIPQLAIGIYMPINAKAIDLLILKIRKRWGAGLVSARNFSAELSSFKDQNYVLGVLADQSPGKSKNNRFYQFLHRLTPFTIGPAKGAVQQRAAVVYATVSKLRRGYYYAHLEEMTPDASAIAPEMLIKDFAQRLELSIIAQPENWLWTHRRWKRAPDADDIIIDRA